MEQWWLHKSNQTNSSTEQERRCISLSLLSIYCYVYQVEGQLPEVVQAKIKAVAGRNKVMPFATRLINLLYSKHGKAFLGRKVLSALLGYENPTQIAKYTNLLRGQALFRLAIATRWDAMEKNTVSVKALLMQSKQIKCLNDVLGLLNGQIALVKAIPQMQILAIKWYAVMGFRRSGK